MNDKELAPVQIYAVLICLIINVLDGFDLLAIAFTANEIAIEWEMSPENLGILFSRLLVHLAWRPRQTPSVDDHRWSCVFLLLPSVCWLRDSPQASPS
jgi:hypothetical protein